MAKKKNTSSLAKKSKGKGKIFLKGLKEYSILTFATIILCFGIHLFRLPNNFTFGGVTGLAILLSAFLPLSTSVLNLIFNVALLIIGYIFLGRSFAFKTVFVSMLYSVVLWLMELYMPITAPLTDQPMLELIYAIFIPSFASAIIFNLNSSSGGTDIIAMIVKKYTSMAIGNALFIVDCIIACLTFLVFDITTGLYSLCGLLAKSLVIDVVIENINTCKYFNIVCQNPDPICDFILNHLKHSATIYNAEGAFTHQKKYVIMAAMSRRQAVQLRNFIKKTEPDAFILISSTSEIIGKGFHNFDF
ncbi:MAG: YitT family protein [Clostridiales bacterium]|nr:YitT family protein [Clostridiales bacterium]